MIQLETYKGTKSRHTCPACNSRNCFVRYVGNDGKYISDDVGRCNRESKCGYHYKPKQYFADNPQNNGGFKNRKRKTKTNYGFADQSGSQTQHRAKITDSKPDFIPFEHFKPTLANYGQNPFVQFLTNLFPNDLETVQDVLKDYFVGTFEDFTCFPQLDLSNRICKAKLIRFNRETGKRLKGEFDTSSLVAKLKKQGKLKDDFNYKQTFFGEHLLKKYPEKPVAIVEAEKTAIIASICFPAFVWLGSNSKTWLKTERLQRIGQNRKIILYPDADGFGNWTQTAQQAARLGLTVKVSDLIEKHATIEQKENGFDLADYLIEEQITKLEQQQEFIDFYNAKVDQIMNDEKLKDDFETILDEQKHVLIDRGMSESEAENLIRDFDNLREVALSI